MHRDLATVALPFGYDDRQEEQTILPFQISHGEAETKGEEFGDPAEGDLQSLLLTLVDQSGTRRNVVSIAGLHFKLH